MDKASAYRLKVLEKTLQKVLVDCEKNPSKGFGWLHVQATWTKERL
uniref:Uncharacterized protein n=1 Tax=Meloidogyne enterolobii TaxID=390850 RepID=A0A6V7U4T4_MELEN|nr:unnamed protein product [Meloidogyne enterolobii]